MKRPDNVKYTAEHEWVARDGDSAKVGITAYAAEALGDVVFVDLPAVGLTVTAGRSCGALESTNSVSDLYAPVTGEVIGINELAEADPGLVNSDPFGDGWLFVVRVTEEIELLDVNAYEALLGG